ncbi:MAG: S8 family serine peptidase, partial [Oscillospiraceae bacterium]|nr:S8 family serine peptidase [Oscillospiraceae bacterium]
GRWKLSVCVAAGNEGGSGHHFSTVMSTGETADADFAAVFPFNELFLDVWWDFSAILEFELISPDGISSGTLRGDTERSIFFGKTAVTIYSRPVTHYSPLCRTLFVFSTDSAGTSGGIWKLRIKCLYALDGRIDIWLPTSEMTGNNASFLYPDDLFTLTVPAAVPKVITAAGYDQATDSIAYFSGRGIRAIAKPDIAAPAVGILSARAGGGYDSFSGTSMAAPFVCAAAALLMQYGITNGRDPFLYGEKLKAVLCLSARRKNRKYPDDSFGYGTLDLEKAITMLNNGGYP